MRARARFTRGSARWRSGRALLVALSLACLPAGDPRVTHAAEATAHVVIDADRIDGPTNRDLLGVGWNSGDLGRIAPFVPSIVRIDSRLESAAPERGVFRLDAVLGRVARVRAAGGEPLVVLYGMPRWLGEPRAARCKPIPIFAPDGCNPVLVAPDDVAAWEDVVATVVRALATAEAPAYRFEAWNEPDLPVFWHDTREAFFETAAATHRAVASVAAETGLPLQVGGPGASAAVFVAEYAAAIVARGLPLGFLSWHWYANNPFLGPDGAEGNLDPAVYELLAGVNPNMTPAVYGEQIRTVRERIAPLLAGTALDPELVIDEWNVSAGGLDLRHDSNEGAAFVAATLIEMERNGLDAAAYYRAISDREAGDWGLIAPDGTKKPAWSVFQAFAIAQGSVLALEGDDPDRGLWARASRRGARVDVLLATFRALGGSARRVTLALQGECEATTASVGRLDARARSWGRREHVRAADGGFTFRMPDQSVAWVRLTCPRPAQEAAPSCLTTASGAPAGPVVRRPAAGRCPHVRRAR